MTTLHTFPRHPGLDPGLGFSSATVCKSATPEKAAQPRVKPGVTIWVGEAHSATHTRHAELVSASISPRRALACAALWALKQVRGDDEGGEG